MAELRYADVYCQDIRAGLLQELPGGRTRFEYASDYLSSGSPLSASMPFQEEAFEGYGLLPYFDNLAAEGWLARLQAKCIGGVEDDKFKLLSAFGYDLIGAVEVRDPDGQTSLKEEYFSEVGWEAYVNRVSFSGVQPKIPLLGEAGNFRMPGPGEASTHIGKLHSSEYPSLLSLEYVSTLMTRDLLPDDEVVEMEWTSLEGVHGDILAVKRFDRPGSEKNHFEEFAQAAGLKSSQKYDYDFVNLGGLVDRLGGSLVDKDRLYRRILAALLIGNSDTHLKNFAWFPGEGLTPGYDLPGCDLVLPHGSDLGMSVNGSSITISQLKVKHLIVIGESLGLRDAAIDLAVSDIKERLPRALNTLSECSELTEQFKDKYTKYIDKSWNRTYSQIGTYLSKRRSSGENSQKSRKGGLRR